MLFILVKFLMDVPEFELENIRKEFYQKYKGKIITSNQLNQQKL